MDLFDLAAKITLDTTNFEHGVSGASDKWEKFASGISSAASKINSIGEMAFKAFSGAASAAATGIGAFAKYVVDAGSNFEAQMSKVAAISGATGESLDALNEKAKEMGAKTKFSATEAGEAFEYMAMAGWKTEQMLGGIEGIMNLAAASGEELGTVSDIVTDALTAFGLKAEDAGHFADVLAAASSNANTNVGMMGETFKYAAPVAGALGFSIEDTAAAIGLMANAGIKGSQAGTALRAVLSRLTNPTKDVNMAMKMLGLSVADEEGKMKSLGDIMGQLREGFKGGRITQDEYRKSLAELEEQLDKEIIDDKEYMESIMALDVALNGATEVQKAQIAAWLGGQEAMSGLLAIIDASPEAYDNLVAAIYSADGAAEKMRDTMQNNLTGAITILKSSLETFALAVYSDAKSPLTDFVNYAQQSVVDLTAAYQSGGFGGAIQKAGEIFGETLSKGIELAPSVLKAGSGLVNKIIGTFTKTLVSKKKSIQGAIKQFGNTLSDGFKTAVDAGTTIIKNFGGDIAEQFLSFKGDIFNAGVDIITSLAEGLGDDSEGLAGAAVGTVKKIVQNISDSLPLITKSGGDILKALGDEISENLPGMLESGKDIILKLSEGLVEAIPNISDTADKCIVAIADFLTDEDNLKDMADAGTKLLEKIGEGLLTIVSTLSDEAPGVISGLVDLLTDEKSLQTIFDVGVKLLGEIGSGLLTVGTTLLENAPQVISSLVNLLISPDNLNKIRDVGIKFLDTAWDAALGLIADVAYSLADEFIYYSGDAEEAGRITGESFIDGLKAVLLHFVGGDLKILDWLGLNPSTPNSPLYDAFYGVPLIGGKAVQEQQEKDREKEAARKEGIEKRRKEREAEREAKRKERKKSNDTDPEDTSSKKPFGFPTSFTTARVPFSESASGRQASSIINGMAAASSGGGTAVINLNVDGEKVASVVYDPLNRLLTQRDVSLRY